MINRLQIFLSKYQIQFKSQEMLNSYKDFQRASQKELINLFLFISIVLISILIVFDLIAAVPPSLILNRIFQIIAMIGAYFLGKISLPLQKALLTGIVGMAFRSLMKKIHILSGGDLRIAFIFGNGLALYEFMLILAMKGVRERSAAYIFLIFMKSMGLQDDISGTSARTLFIIPLAFFGVVLYAYNTLQDYRLFKDIYESRDKLQKFQELLSNDFPLSVAILNSKLSSIVYSNKFFNDHFVPRSLNQEKISVLRELILHTTGLPPSIPSPRSHQEQTIVDFIHETEFTNEGQVLTLNVVYENPTKGKLFYEVKIRRIIWNEEEAYAVVFDDISDKQMVMALKYADEQKDRVIATVSHELRTPINGILGLIEIIASKISDPLIHKYLENCKSCSKLLLYLVNCILNLSQLRNNKLTVTKEDITLSKLLEEIRSLYIFDSQQKGIDFVIQRDPQVPQKIYTDQYKLIGILINLISNAMKFTFKGSVTLSISLDKSDPQKAVFRVKDTGIGIQENDKEQLFKMFGTIKQQDNRINTQGVGLGLTIASGLVKALSRGEKEKIEFESTYGKGTQFWFKVDICPADIPNNSLEKDLYVHHQGSEVLDSRELTELPEDEYKGPEGNMRKCSPLETKKLRALQKVGKASRKKNILIVDDVPLNLTAVEFILKKLGFETTKAYNGREAILELLKREKNFCLILTDIQMPIMDGVEMSKEITNMIQRKEVDKIPLVCLTAKRITEKEEKDFRTVGIEYALEKPLVEAKIKHVFEKLGLL